MQLAQTLLDLFLPDTCALCRAIVNTRRPHLCCDHCWRSLPRLTAQCRHCAASLAEPGLCGRCLRKPLTMGIAVAPLRYEGDASLLTHALKFQGSLRAARVLAWSLGERIECTYGEDLLPEMIVPTPLSWRRRVRRGYNQCDRLAVDLGQLLDVPVGYALRRKHGPVQHGRSRAARESMPLSTFTWKYRAKPAHIALVDDVMTTGTTMQTMARVCAQAGVRRIDVWAPCRAV